MNTAESIERLLQNETQITLSGDEGYSLVFETKKINSGKHKNSFVTTYRLLTPEGGTMKSPYDNDPPEHWKREDNVILINDNLQTIVNNLVKLAGWRLEDEDNWI